MQAFNLQLFRAINGWSQDAAPFWRFFSEAANYTWMKLLLAAMTIGMIVAKGKPRTAAIIALLSVGLGNLFTDFWKHGLPMHRPFQELNDVLLRAGESPSFGTASAHSANMAAVAFVFCYHLKWWGTPWVVVALLTGISRVYVGVHYPYQVLLGWTTGVVAALLVTKSWELIKKRRADVITSNGPQQPTAEQH